MPPACNTGVHPPCPQGQQAPEPFFDWYRATVATSVENLTRNCLDIAGPYPEIVNGNGRFNYRHSRTINAGGDRVATILHGGTNGAPNVEASGNRAAALATMLREGGPHKVTRLDVAVDLYGEGLFEELDVMAKALAARFNLKSRRISNDDPEDGDTRYIGSRKSVVFARIYEKGKADRLNYGGVESDLLKPWVRLELEVKPQKEMKEAAARLQPAEFFGASEWTQQLALETFNMAADPIPFQPKRDSSDAKAYRFALAQYGAIFRRRIEAVHEGDREAFAAQLIADLFAEEDSAAA